MKRTAILTAIASVMLLSVAPARADVIFTLDPLNGVLAGQAGTAVGWGYDLVTTDPAVFLKVQWISFFDAPGVGTFSSMTTSDVAMFGTTLHVSWLENLTGLQYDISSLATLGQATQGSMLLCYDMYSDVSADAAHYLGSDFAFATDGTTDVLASVTVNQDAAALVPEPGTLGCLALACGVGLAIKRRTAARRR